MKFKMTHKVTGKEQFFTDKDAPVWLTSENTVKGSTMDNRCFWNDVVLNLDVGCKTETDFNVIERIE